MALWMRNGTDPYDAIPAVWEHVNHVYRELCTQGIDVNGMPLVGTWLRELGGFSEIEDTVTSIPVGDWEDDELQKEIGIMARDNIMHAFLSTHPLWYRAGKTQQEVEHFFAAARSELYDNGNDLFERLYYTFARKEELPFEDDF